MVCLQQQMKPCKLSIHFSVPIYHSVDIFYLWY